MVITRVRGRLESAGDVSIQLNHRHGATHMNERVH